MIEIWMIDITNQLTDDQYASLLSDLAPKKRQRIEKFHRKKDAYRSLMGDIAVRTLIFKHLALEKQEIIFEQNTYGKPFLSNHDDFHFNISHSGKYVACAVSNLPIGIDVEIIKPIDLAIARRFFTDTEIQYIVNGKTGSVQQSRFYTIWTRKEAYIKLRGQGLHIPLDSFDVLNPQTHLFYSCIHQDDSSICHICTEKKEAPLVQYCSAETLFSLYESHQAQR